MVNYGLLTIFTIFTYIIICDTSQNVTDESTKGNFFTKLIPASILNIFSAKNQTKNEGHSHEMNQFNESADVQSSFDSHLEKMTALDDSYTMEEYHTEEHGSLHSVGRDFVRKVSNTFERMGKALGIDGKNVTEGLDTNKTFFNGVLDNFKKHVSVIYPGTLWCGDGDRAKSFDSLGTFQKTDKCCRGHDKCPIALAKGEIKHGLENTGLFTRSHCDCDVEFYNCLKTANTIVSRKLGFAYFTVVGPQCFKEEQLIIGCVHYNKGKCIQYHLDEKSVDRLYQWFDNPPF